MIRSVAITLLYLLFGLAWIYFSDEWVFQIWSGNVEWLHDIQNLKGYLFVAISAILIFILNRTFYRDVEGSEKQKSRLVEELQERNSFIEMTLQNLPIGIAVSKIKEQTPVLINDRFLKIANLSKNDIVTVEALIDKISINADDGQLLKNKLNGEINDHKKLIEWNEVKIKSGDQIKTVMARSIPLFEQNLMVTAALDISEQAKAKELFQQIVENIPVLLTIYDPIIQEAWVNTEFEQVTGWTNEELKSVNIVEVCYPEEEERTRAVEFMSQTGIGWKEFTLTTRDGQRRQQEWTNIRLEDDTGVGIGIDVTELRRSEHQLKEAKALLENTFNSLDESVIILDARARVIVDCNISTEMIFGYDREQIIGQSSLILHVDRKHYEQFGGFGEGTLEKDGIFHCEFEMKRSDGTVFSSEHTVSVVYDRKGNWDKVVSVIRDISERKKSLSALESSEAKFQSLFKESPVPTWILEAASYQILEANAAFLDKYGYKAEELSDLTFWDLLPNRTDELHLKDAVRNQMESVEHGHNQSLITNHQQRDGDLMVVQLNVSRINISDKEALLVTGADISAELNSEKELANAILEATEFERKRIARELHDGPTQYLSMASIHLKELPEKSGHSDLAKNQLFQSTLDHIRNGIEQTRDLSHGIMPRFIDGDGLINALRQLIGDFKKSSKLNVTFECNDDIKLKDDYELNIFRVVQECLNNVQKHAKATKVNIQLNFDPSGFLLEVVDNGAGFDSRNTVSSGIGLRVIRSRVSQLNGFLEINSRPNEGCTVRVRVTIGLRKIIAL